MKTLLSSLFIICGLILAPPAEAASQGKKLKGLLQNEDCTNFFYHQDVLPGKAGELVDRYVDVLADAGVTVLINNTNARRTNYRSKVWEAFWDGYDPQGPDDQPFLAGLPRDRVKAWRKLIGNMLELDRQGIDYPARMIERCRQRGISPWISLRMNDVHENNNLAHPFHSALWRQTELFRQGDPGYFARALDYAHSKVRDHYRALIVETLERYDIDGLELDFLREPYLFSAGKEQEGGKILTEWLRSIRKLANETAARRGHEIKIGVRVPASPETAIGLGLDAPAWAKENLVDLVVVAPRFTTIDYNLPLEEWRKLLGPRVTLAGGLEVNYRPNLATLPRLVRPDQANGAVVSVLSGGADVVYLFNYFQHGHPGLSPEIYRQTLRSFSSLEAAVKNPRFHAVTFRDVTVPGSTYRPPLPATGNRFSFALPLGPTPPADWRVEATILIATSEKEIAPPAVAVNGEDVALSSRRQEKDGSVFVMYDVPVSALKGRNDDVVAVKAQGEKLIKLLRVEMRLRPRQ